MEVESSEDSPPLCPVCNHRHFQGIKCSVCGHVGRSQMYQKMRVRATEKRVTKSTVYDGSAFSSCLDDWDLLMEMRKSVYCSEYATPLEEEFNESQETGSRHVICYGTLTYSHY